MFKFFKTIILKVINDILILFLICNIKSLNFEIEVYCYDFKIIGLNFNKNFESFYQLFCINHRNNLFLKCD